MEEIIRIFLVIIIFFFGGTEPVQESPHSIQLGAPNVEVEPPPGAAMGAMDSPLPINTPPPPPTLSALVSPLPTNTPPP